MGLSIPVLVPHMLELDPLAEVLDDDDGEGAGMSPRCLSLSSLSSIREVELRVLLWQRDVGGGMFSGQTGRGAAGRHKK